MGVLEDTAQQARVTAQQLKVTIPSKRNFFLKQQRDLNKQFDVQVSDFVDKSLDGAKPALDNIHEKANSLVTDIRTATRNIERQMAKVNGMVSTLQTTLANIQNTDFDDLDASSKQMLMDFSNEYKSAYTVMWVKIVLVAVLFYYLRADWVLILVAYFAVYIVWTLISALIKLFQNIRKKESTLRAETCANVTDGDAVGSTCKPTSPSYAPCSSSVFGCCPNGLASTSDVSACGTFDCWQSAFGCCPNGTNKKSETDTCDAPVDCKTTKFGCCLNGMPREDTVGSNCTMNSACGYTTFGCCPDGTPRSDVTGTNCRTEAPIETVTKVITSAQPSFKPPNPFTTSNGAGFMSGFQAIS